ncbi:MAG: ABC transporter substrate-binding protein [Erysipelotrichaceae bacterium]|nr:ABC transporter substrate-binding protein [Erysipelotrichaceae bacterium]
MKKWLSVIAVLLLLCGCSNGGSSAAPASEGDNSCKVLNVFNWGEYIGENTIAEFENQFGVRVNYTLFDSNEAMYTKLMGGTSYDILIPSDYMIEKLLSEDLLQPIDKSLIPNMDKLYDGVLNKVYDPDNTYSVPYFWGNVGIVYDTTIIDAADVEAEGWDVLHNTKYAGKIYMYDSERDSFMVALKALGYSTNTENLEELQAAYDWLANIHATMDPAYVTDEAIDGLIYGEKAMGVMYSGDAAYILSENENMAYYEPQQGTNLWNDAMVIPKNAACPELANQFINFMLEYDVAYDNSATVGYSSSVAEVLEDMTAEGGDYEGINAYLPRTTYEKDEPYYMLPEEARATISELWVKVKGK